MTTTLIHCMRDACIMCIMCMVSKWLSMKPCHPAPTYTAGDVERMVRKWLFGVTGVVYVTGLGHTACEGGPHEQSMQSGPYGRSTLTGLQLRAGPFHFSAVQHENISILLPSTGFTFTGLPGRLLYSGTLAQNFGNVGARLLMAEYLIKSNLLILNSHKMARGFCNSGLNRLLHCGRSI